MGMIIVSAHSYCQWAIGPFARPTANCELTWGQGHASLRRTKSATVSSSARAVGDRPSLVENRRGIGENAAERAAQHLAALAEGGGGDPLQRRADRPPAVGGPRSQLHDRRGDLGRRHEGRGRDVEQAAHRRRHAGPAPRAGRSPWCAAGRPAGRRPPSGTSAPCRRRRPPAAASAPAGPSRRCRAGWRRSGAARGPSSARTARRASAWTTCSRPAAARTSSSRAATALASTSMATTWLAPSRSRARVRPPGPGPTSITVPSASGAAARAMRRVRLRSSRKCWPRRLRASRPWAAMVSRSGGSPASASISARRSGCDAGGPCRRPSRSAAIRLAGSARPVPAMSSAVPWSGEVRTKGRPRVTLTPPAKVHGLDRDQRLVVIHAERRVIGRAGGGMEQRVGRRRAAHVDAVALQRVDRRRDHPSSPRRPSSPARRHAG